MPRMTSGGADPNGANGRMILIGAVRAAVCDVMVDVVLFVMSKSLVHTVDTLSCLLQKKKEEGKRLSCGLARYLSA